MRLIDKLKPEVLEALEETKIRYGSSYRAIIASLSSVDDYKDLTLNQLNTIVCFLPQEYKPHSPIGWMYGDNILDKKYRL